MKKFLLAASLLAITGMAAPVVAQDPTTVTGSLSASDVGVSPLSGTSGTDYVKLAADSDLYEIQSSRIAVTKSKREDVKVFAKQMIIDHTGTAKALTAALRNGDRVIATPSTQLSAENAAKIALLRKAPKASFDDLYLQQQLQGHQAAWALNKGYALDGTDPALKQVASTAVPVIERHIAHLKSLLPASMGGL